MKIIFRLHTHTPEEIQLGHKIGFTVPRDVDAISVTANANGFTPCTAALRAIDRRADEFQTQIQDCRSMDRVLEAHDCSPSVIFVPPTRGATGKSQSFEFYAIEILRICNFRNAKCLHFTHYGFINGDFQWLELHRAMVAMLNPLIYTTLEKMYFEIDSRHFESASSVVELVGRSIYRNINFRLDVIKAPQFGTEVETQNEDGSQWVSYFQK